MNTEVVMIRTIGGEYLVATKEIDNEENKNIFQNNKVTLKDVRILKMQRTIQGAAVMFMPLCPFQQKLNKELDNIEMDKLNIMLEVHEKDVDGEIVNGYKSNISGIDMSAASPSIVV